MQFDLITVLIGLMATIMVAGVPWAYRVGERLASIETEVKMIKVGKQVEQDDIVTLTTGIRQLQSQLASGRES